MSFGIITSNSNPGPNVVTTSNLSQTPASDGGYQMGQSVTDPIAFYGATPVVQPAASVDLLTQLVTNGLVAPGTAIQISGGSSSIVNAAGATLAVTQALHAGKVITLNKANGQAITLPPATGSGANYTFAVETTITSVGTTITTGVTGASSDAFQGIALTEDGGTLTGWLATAGAGGSDVITLNGSTTGGFVGDLIELKDVGAGVWQIMRFITKSTGPAATPFSHV